MTKVFIDGSSGTTGLQIRQRLEARPDIEPIDVPHDLRHDPDTRRDAMKTADVVFFCLPDAAAIEAADLAEDTGAVVIDASTAHRTSDGWVYGLPELDGQREKIANARWIANPGCHATGFIVLIAPLVKAGLIDPGIELSCFSLTGYSGGGKKMIAQYEEANRDSLLKSPRMYGLGQKHKHLPEMTKLTGLEKAPIFCPVVGDFYSGMETIIPLFADDVRCGPEDIAALYEKIYDGPVIRYVSGDDGDGFTASGKFSGRDDMTVSVYGNEERILLTARYDNLGKGASGAAIQNMNIVIGAPETEGLVT